MKIRNINELYGDAVEFDSVEEMAEAVIETECLEDNPDLKEGIDYEIVEEKLTMIIASASCDGEEKQFAAWMTKNYPEIETRIENNLHGGLFDEIGDRIVENFWDQYCSE